VVVEQVEESHRQVLAGGDGPPAADRVEAHRDAVLGHQVRVLGAADRQPLDVRVRFLDRLLVDLLLGGGGLVAQEVDRQVEQTLVCAVGEHVLHRRDDAFGLQVAAAHAVGAGVERRRVAHALVCDKLRVHGLGGIAAVLQALAQGRADLAHQRQVDGERLVQALEHGHALLAANHPADQVGRALGMRLPWPRIR
jgi:hypothetical protein